MFKVYSMIKHKGKKKMKENGNHSVTGARSTARFGFYSLNQDVFFFLGGGISLWNRRGKRSRVISVFFGESMFTKKSDASKAAFVTLVR